MALTPASCDPNRKSELERLKKIANGANGKEIAKQEFNMDLDNQTKIEIKDTEGKKEEKSAKADK